MRAIISVSFPEELASELNRLAKETGRTKSEIIKEALRAYIWEERFKKLVRSVRVKARKRGFVTDGDVLKAIS